MNDSGADMNLQLVKPDSPSPSRDGLPSIYSVLNLPNDKLHIDDCEDPPTASGPAELPVTAQAAAHELEPKQNIGNMRYRQICLLCLVAAALIVIVVGLSIHVSQIRQSKETCHRNYHELNSTLQSKLSALKFNLSVFKQVHSDLHHQFCKFLTSRRETTCPQEWTKNEDHCYFISTFGTSYDGARQNCSELDSRLLEINSNKEKIFVSNAVERYVTYWIGKCSDKNVSSDLMYELNFEKPTCSKCGSSYRYSCNGNYRFICEKTAYLYPDIPEDVQGLCQLPFGPTSIK
ncbi:C-type lectin domain family 9 member A-like [Hypanus sabinus]|uniref:C-type lectin domain family 9 member A-like n=1 Tax=Hypanus sabinus TaxID=79690 RepID=UPI0028C44D69|nr:C-type lectin domain family 9 member A-like [Hypanus sabinus]